MRQKLIELQGKIDKSTVIVGDFDTPLSVIDSSNRQKISKDVVKLNSNVNQLDLIDIYRTLHPTTAAYTFFSSSHGTFTKIDYILVINTKKTHLSKSENIEIMQSRLLDHSESKLRINYRKRARKSPNIWRLNNRLLNKMWVIEGSREI